MNIFEMKVVIGVNIEIFPLTSGGWEKWDHFLQDDSQKSIVLVCHCDIEILLNNLEYFDKWKLQKGNIGVHWNQTNDI